MLEGGYNLLRQRAVNIEDDKLRNSYLKNVPANRELLRAWEERDGDC